VAAPVDCPERPVAAVEFSMRFQLAPLERTAGVSLQNAFLSVDSRTRRTAALSLQDSSPEPANEKKLS
jgi:hypothetical protein